MYYVLVVGFFIEAGLHNLWKAAINKTKVYKKRKHMKYGIKLEGIIFGTELTDVLVSP